MAMRSPNRNAQTPKQHVSRAAGGLSFVIGQKQKDDNDSTDRQSPPQRMPNDLPGYEGLVWRNVTKQKFRIPENDRSRLDSWVWKQKHGWRVWDNTGEEYWLCKICHGRRSTNKHWFKSLKSTTRAGDHMKAEHRISAEGEIPPSPEHKKKRKLDQYLNGYDAVTAVENTSLACFSLLGFRALLLQWIVADNIAFNKVESPHLRRLIGYANPRARLPSRTSISRWIAQAYDQQLGVVTETLASAITKISLSFDMWTSGSNVALLGIVAHFIDMKGKPTSMLLSLPRQHGRHTGTNIADTVASIVAEYDLSHCLGYFITDNASNNATCISALAEEFQFSAKSRWIRCSGHILNLVAQSILFGNDVDALEVELLSTQDEESRHMDVWRRKGPCGKLHNIVKYIKRSPQRIEQFEDIQRRLVSPIRPAGKAEVYKLVDDNDTRWNSMDDCIERALYLQPALDEFIEKEIDNCHVARRRKQKVLRPSIVDDHLTLDDWEVLKAYHEILQPIKTSTDILQGQIGGRFGAIWQVLPQFEILLTHLEEQRQRHLPQLLERCSCLVRRVSQGSQHKCPNDCESPHGAEGRSPEETTCIASEQHFSTNINAGWQKLNDYYKRLDDNVVYVAAVVLHPRMKWRYFKTKWSDHEDWLSTWKAELDKFWRHNYEHKPGLTPSNSAGTDSDSGGKSVKHAADEWSDGEDSGLDQLEQYLSEQPDRSYSSADSPIKYWLARRKMWPQLAKMALDIYAVPAMADEPERIFSQAGETVSARRRRMSDDTVASLMCLKSWQSSGIITIDESLFARAIEATDENEDSVVDVGDQASL